MNEYTTFIHFILVITAIYLLWRFGIRSVMLDHFRALAFELRAELFDLAASGKIDFDSEVYRHLEHRINVAIRYRQVHSPYIASAMVVVLRGSRERARRANRAFTAAVAKIEDADTRREVKSISHRLAMRLGIYGLTSSPLMYPFILIGTLGVLTYRLVPTRRHPLGLRTIQLGEQIEDVLQYDERTPKADGMAIPHA